MPVELERRDDSLSRHLRAALETADEDDARYHIREALQLRIAEANDVDLRT